MAGTTRSSFVFLRRKTKSKTTSALREEAEVVLFCQGKTKQKTTRKPKAEAAFLFCFCALPFRGRGKSKTKPLPASRKIGKESAGRDGGRKPWGKEPQNTPARPTRHIMPQQERRSQRPLGGKIDPASGGRDDMSRRGHGSSLKPPQRQGAGRSRAVRQTFFLRAKIFQRQKRRLRCPRSNRNLHTRRCAAG